MTITATIRGAQRGIKLPPGFAVRGDGKWQPHSGTQPCHREQKKSQKKGAGWVRHLCFGAFYVAEGAKKRGAGMQVVRDGDGDRASAPQVLASLQHGDASIWEDQDGRPQGRQEDVSLISRGTEGHGQGQPGR